MDTEFLIGILVVLILGAVVFVLSWADR